MRKIIKKLHKREEKGKEKQRVGRRQKDRHVIELKQERNREGQIDRKRQRRRMIGDIKREEKRGKGESVM